jgi:hypothetical protein
MNLIMIGGYCITLGLGALLYKYVTDKRKARKATPQRPSWAPFQRPGLIIPGRCQICLVWWKNRCTSS